MTDVDPADPIQQLARALDEVAGMVAGLTAYVAHLPGANETDIDAVRTLAQKIAPQAIANRSPAPIQHALVTVDRLSSIARSLAAGRSQEQSGST